MKSATAEQVADKRGMLDELKGKINELDAPAEQDELKPLIKMVEERLKKVKVPQVFTEEQRRTVLEGHKKMREPFRTPEEQEVPEPFIPTAAPGGGPEPLTPTAPPLEESDPFNPVLTPQQVAAQRRLRHTQEQIDEVVEALRKQQSSESLEESDPFTPIASPLEKTEPFAPTLEPEMDLSTKILIFGVLAVLGALAIYFWVKTT